MNGALMHDAVEKRLQSLGYDVLPGDGWLINYTVEKVIYEIRNECNVGEVPDGLFYVAVDMACGEFLSAKKGSGQLEGFDTDAAIKSIKEGDTAITYAVADGAAAGLDALIGAMTNGNRAQLAAYRRIAW